MFGLSLQVDTAISVSSGRCSGEVQRAGPSQPILLRQGDHVGRQQQTPGRQCQQREAVHGTAMTIIAPNIAECSPTRVVGAGAPSTITVEAAAHPTYCSGLASAPECRGQDCGRRSRPASSRNLRHRPGRFGRPLASRPRLGTNRTQSMDVLPGSIQSNRLTVTVTASAGACRLHARIEASGSSAARARARSAAPRAARCFNAVLRGVL